MFVFNFLWYWLVGLCVVLSMSCWLGLDMRVTAGLLVYGSEHCFGGLFGGFVSLVV